MEIHDAQKFYGLTLYPEGYFDPETGRDMVREEKRYHYGYLSGVLLRDMGMEIRKELSHGFSAIHVQLGRGTSHNVNEAFDMWDASKDAQGRAWEMFYGAMLAMVQGKPGCFDLAEQAFLHHGWLDDYGGVPWAKIARGAKLLSGAKTLGEQEVAIDHAFDLAHNNSNLLCDFPSGEQFWLPRFLDMKRENRHGWAYHLHVPSIFKSDVSRRQRTVHESLFMMDDSASDLLYNYRDYILSRLWSLSEVAIGEHLLTNPKSCSSVGVSKVLAKLIKESIPRMHRTLHRVLMNSIRVDRAVHERLPGISDVKTWIHPSSIIQTIERGKSDIDRNLQRCQREIKGALLPLYNSLCSCL